MKTRNMMRINEIQKSFMLGLFALNIQVVYKFAKERRVSCQENSHGSILAVSSQSADYIYLFLSIGRVFYSVYLCTSKK